MAHLTDRTLERLITGSASPVDVQRIRRHVGGCRACARRLEEWRDNFTQVEERFPELGADAGPASAVTPAGLVMLPSEDIRRFGVDLDLTTSLWIGAALMALLVGYGTFRLGQTREGPEVSTLNLPQSPQTEPESRPTTTLPAIPPASRGDSLPRRAPAPRPPTPAAAPRPAAGSQAAATPLPVSPQFQSASLAVAARRLGGPLRFIRGMEPDHVEIGPASAVPGAQSGLEVIRVVYRASDGRRILLDQQLIPADSSGFRPIEDQTLESGQTAFGTAANGLNVATWLDDDGYRLSLALRAPLDSLKRLLPRVR